MPGKYGPINVFHQISIFFVPHVAYTTCVIRWSILHWDNYQITHKSFLALSPIFMMMLTIIMMMLMIMMITRSHEAILSCDGECMRAKPDCFARATLLRPNSCPAGHWSYNIQYTFNIQYVVYSKWFMLTISHSLWLVGNMVLRCYIKDLKKPWKNSPFEL